MRSPRISFLPLSSSIIKALSNESQEHELYSSGRSHRSHESFSRRREPARTPSLSGYMTAAAAASAALFFVLWWMLQGEENPWVPAGFAASVVMLVAASARVLVIRRARTRYVREQGGEWRSRSRKQQSRKVMNSTSLHTAALRALQKQS